MRPRRVLVVLLALAVVFNLFIWITGSPEDVHLGVKEETGKQKSPFEKTVTGLSDVKGRLLPFGLWRSDFEKRTIIVGDVHACFDELMTLLSRCEYSASRGYRLIFIGDLIGKGPKPRHVLQYASQRDAQCIVGNHDLLLIEWFVTTFPLRAHKLMDPTNPANSFYFRDGGNYSPTKRLGSDYLHLARSLNDDEWRFFLSCRLYMILEDRFISHKNVPSFPETFSSSDKLITGLSIKDQLAHLSTTGNIRYSDRFFKKDILLVHAGIQPGIPIEKQKPSILTTIRNINDDGTPTKSQFEGNHWISRLDNSTSSPFVVFGHDAIRGLQVENSALGIDTGCCYGGYLSAFVLPQQEIIQAAALAVYEVPKLKI